jgi:hypothetical protein
VDARIELGLLYLDQVRLADAEHYFAELGREQPVQVYATLAEVGQAMTLAFQNETRKSNARFRELLEEKVLAPGLVRDRGGEDVKAGSAGRWYLNNHPQLRAMVARAVEHNYRADPRNFPSELEPLRKVPAGKAGPAPAEPPKRPPTKRES